MKKILVSGGTGFIGRHIVAAAREQGFEVTNLSRSTSTLAHHNINVDLCRFSPTISDSFDLVVHLAGVSNNNHKFCNYWQANIVGTYNLLKGLAGAHVSKFILISAASLYNGQRGGTIQEGGDLVNLDGYSISKRGSELVVEESSLIEHRLVLRIPGVLGPNAPTSWPARFLHAAKMGLEITAYNPDNLYNHCLDIASLSEFIVDFASKATHNFDVVNLAASDPLTIRECVKILSRGFCPRVTYQVDGVDSRIISIDRAISRYAYKPVGVQQTLEKYVRDLREKD